MVPKNATCPPKIDLILCIKISDEKTIMIIIISGVRRYLVHRGGCRKVVYIIQ